MVREATHHIALLMSAWGRMMGSGRAGTTGGVRIFGGAGFEPEKNAKGGLGARPSRGIALLTNAELVDDRAVALHVDLLEVIQQTAATSDQLEKPAAGVMVLRVGLEMLGQVANAVREECDLHFWRPGICVMDAIRVDEVRLLFLRRRQNPVS